MSANLPFLIGFAFDALILLLFWIWSRKPRKKPRYKPKPPSPFAGNSQGSHNSNIQGHTVNVHPPSRDLTPTELMMKEMAEAALLLCKEKDKQLKAKQKNIEDLQEQCKYKEGWVKFWKESSESWQRKQEACEAKCEQLEQTLKQQKRKLKAKHNVPYIEMGDLKERLQELYA